MLHLAYLHVSTNQDAAAQFQEVYNNLCKNDANSLQKLLRMIAQGNRLLAVDIFGLGYNLVEKGEVTQYITK